VYEQKNSIKSLYHTYNTIKSKKKGNKKWDTLRILKQRQFLLKEKTKVLTVFGQLLLISDIKQLKVFPTI
jgi:hypothetical protein